MSFRSHRIKGYLLKVKLLPFLDFRPFSQKLVIDSILYFDMKHPLPEYGFYYIDVKVIFQKWKSLNPPYFPIPPY